MPDQFVFSHKKATIALGMNIDAMIFALMLFYNKIQHTLRRLAIVYVQSYMKQNDKLQSPK